MKLGALVGWILALFFLGYGLILIFGVVPPSISWFSFFLFISIFFTTIILMNRRIFKENSDLFFLIGAFLLLSIFLAMFGTELKSYIANKDVGESGAITPDELQALEAQNTYYTQYVQYLQAQIEQYHKNSQALQLKLIMVQQQTAALENLPAQQPVEPQRRYYDDDDEDDDDD